MTRRIAVGAVALAFSTLLAARVSTQSPAPLFVSLNPGRAAASIDQNASAAVADRALIGMRIDALFTNGIPQAVVRLNVDGRDWIARLQRVDSDVLGFRSWVGDIEGVPFSHVVFSERAGTVSGLIDAVSSRYRIRTADAGTYILERMIADTSRRDSEPPVGVSRVQEEAAAADRVAAADTAATIDVLMLYTPNAKAKAGGVSQIQAIAAQVISDSNTIYSRSNVTTRLRLAGTQEFALVEASSMNSDLNQVTDSTIAHSLRDTYRADLVQLLESSPDMTICGLGWLLTSLSTTNFDAYSVVDVDCVSQYSPTHEMGHNMGSHHAPEDGASGALFTYSYGYKDAAHGFRTVMASSCSTGSCPRIANFSNPGIFNNGYVTGTNNQNNSLSINNAAATVANWRQSGASSGSGGTGGGGTGGGTPGVWAASVTALVSTVTATWPVAPNGFVPTSYQVEIVNSATSGTVAIVDVGTALFYSTTLADGSYVLRVRALGPGGVGATTTDASFLIGPPVANVAPLPPTNLRFDLSGGRVTLSWNVSAATAPWSSFIIDVGSASSLGNLGSYDTGSTQRQFVAAQPLPGVYFVRVRARNAFGVSGPSNEVLVYIPGQAASTCSGPPAAPVGLASTVVGSFVTLSWTYGVSPQPVSSYRLDVGSAAGLSNLLQYQIGPATIFGGNAASGVYFARVRAVNACGVSGPSNEIIVNVP